MTVIAATAATPSFSPSSGAGGQGVDQGFDALLAVVTTSDEPAPPRHAPTQGASKTADKADLADKTARADTASAKAEEAAAAAAAQAQACDAAEDAAEDAAAEDVAEAAAQAEAAALAAATLVAAMMPQTEETFAASTLPDVDATASLVSAPAPITSDLVASQALSAAVPAPSEAALDAASLVAPTLAEAATTGQGVVTQPVADARGAASAPAASATIDIPESALLEAPIAAEDAGVDIAALAAQATQTPTVAAKPAPQTTPAVAAPTVDVMITAEPVVIAAEVEASPVVAAPVVETAPPADETVKVVAQAAAETVTKVATATIAPIDAEPAASTEAETVKIAGVETASLADQAGADQGGDAQQGGQGQASAEALSAGAVDGAATPDAPTISQTTAATVAAGPEVAPALRAETRGSPETVAQLSAEILKKLDAQTTRFDVALTPEGLGKVDVRIEIGRHGALTASMAFDTAQAAAELRSKSAELRQALSQAGFTIADNALRFDVSSQGGQNGQNAFFNFNGGEDGRRAWSGKAFQSAQNDDAPILSASDLLPGLRMAPDSGLDIRI